jgi:NAD+ synthase (glutamine-hydrolysing)
MTDPSDDAFGFTPAANRRAFRVAVAQIAPTLGNLERNLAMHLAQIEAARAAGADLLVFPELSLTGYYLRDQVPEVAQPIGSALLRQVHDAAGEMALIFGFVEESINFRFYNAAMYAEPGRAVVHRKVYLPTYGMFDEGRYFAPGRRIRAFDTKFGRLGLLICEDAWHLSSGVILQSDRIDALVLIANSPGRGVRDAVLSSRKNWELVSRTYATFLGVPTVFANRVGYEDGVCFFGASQVVSPLGDVLAAAPELDEALIVADIDPSQTRQHHILAPVDRDERLDITLAELNRIQDGRYRDTAQR